MWFILRCKTVFGSICPESRLCQQEKLFQSNPSLFLRYPLLPHNICFLHFVAKKIKHQNSYKLPKVAHFDAKRFLTESDPSPI